VVVPRPQAELLLLVGGQPEQFADDGDRDPERVVPDEVHLGASGDGVEQLGGDGLDTRAQALHPARGERLADEFAQPGVVGRVGGAGGGGGGGGAPGAGGGGGGPAGRRGPRPGCAAGTAPGRRRGPWTAARRRAARVRRRTA